MQGLGIGEKTSPSSSFYFFYVTRVVGISLDECYRLWSSLILGIIVIVANISLLMDEDILVFFLTRVRPLKKVFVFLEAKLLYIFFFLSVRPSVSPDHCSGNVIFSAAIENRQLKFSVEIPMLSSASSLYIVFPVCHILKVS